MMQRAGTAQRNGARQVKLSIGDVSEALGLGAPRRLYAELAVVAGVLIVAAAWGVYLFSQFDFLRLCRGFDLWFDSDPARTIANVTDRWVIFHERSVLHPLYSLFIAGPFGLLSEALNLRTSTLMAVYVAVQSACLSGAFYVAMRASGLMRLDALMGVLLLNSTAAAIYWVGFPEWIAFAATTLMISLMWIAAPEALRNRFTGGAQSLLSASMVTTNWAIGMAASLLSDFPKLRWGQAFSHTRDALAFMAGFAVIQYFIFPLSGAFLNVWREAGIFLQPEEASRSIAALTVEFFGQTLVAPSFAAVEGARDVPGWGVLIMTSQNQGVAVTSLTLGIFALWAALLALGGYALWRGKIARPPAVLALVSIGFFYVLHMVLGGEIFLFSLHVAPFAAFIALWGTQDRFKWAARGLCAALIALSFTYNLSAFNTATATHNAIDLSWLDRTDHPASAIVAQTDCR